MRRNKKHTILLILLISIGIITAGYFFLYYGLGQIVNYAFSLKRPETASTTGIQKNPQILVDPVLQDVPYATNSASILINGITTPEQVIDFYQNDEKIDSIKSDFDGNFTFQIYLKPGKNSVYVKSSDVYTKKSKTSKHSTILFLNAPPELNLENNLDGKTVSTQFVDIKGTTEKEVFVQINSAPVVVRADGSFVFPFKLKDGDNDIRITAVDIAENITEKSIRVKYQKE